MELKNGDKVRYIKFHAGMEVTQKYPPIGSIGIVEDADGTGIPGIRFPGRAMYYYYEDTFEKVEDSKVEKMPELKTGMVIKTANGGPYRIFTNVIGASNKIVAVCRSGYFIVECDEYGVNDADLPEFNIVEVYYNSWYTSLLENPNTLDLSEYTKIWEYRAPKKEMTVAEIEAKLGHPVKIVKE